MKLKYFVLSLLPLASLFSCNKKPVVTGDIEFDFNIAETTNEDKQIEFVLAPSFDILKPTSDYHVDVSWGDGNSDTFNNEKLDEDNVFYCTHDYQEAKNYHIQIFGLVSGISFSKKVDEKDDRVMFDNNNIYIDNFVINSFSEMKEATDYSDIILGGVTETNQISLLKNVTINYPFTCFSGLTFTNTSLKTVTLPDSLLYINSKDFAGINSLETINLSNNSKLTIIESGSFSGCSSLKSFLVPSYIYELGSEVFSGCSSLETLKFLSITPVSIKDNIFGQGESRHIPEKIIVPKGCKKTYVSTWTEQSISPDIIAKIIEE